MAWWTKIGGTLKKHDTKLAAGIALNFAVNVGGKRLQDCGLYRRDPSKYLDEPNLLPGEMAKAEDRALAAQLRKEARRR